MGLDAMILVFWMLSFKPAFILSSFTFIKRLFSSSSLSAIRVVSSAYLRLLFWVCHLISTSATSSVNINEVPTFSRPQGSSHITDWIEKSHIFLGSQCYCWGSYLIAIRQGLLLLNRTVTPLFHPWKLISKHYKMSIFFQWSYFAIYSEFWIRSKQIPTDWLIRLLNLY